MFLALLLGLGIEAAPLSAPADSSTELSVPAPPVAVPAQEVHISRPFSPRYRKEYLNVIGYGAAASSLGSAWGLVAGWQRPAIEQLGLAMLGSMTGYPLGCAYGAVVLDSSQEHNSSYLVTLLGAATGEALGGLLGYASYRATGWIPLVYPWVALGTPLGALTAQRFWISTNHAPQIAVVIPPRGGAGATLTWSLP